MEGDAVPAAAMANALRRVAAAAASRERLAAVAGPGGAAVSAAAAGRASGARGGEGRVAANPPGAGCGWRSFRAGAAAVIAIAALLPPTPPLAAQNTHLLLISGLGGDPEYTEAFHGWLSRFADAATERYGVPAERIVYLAERTDLDPTRIRSRSTADNIRAAFAEIAAAMAPNDELVVLLAGHGTFTGGEARFNVPGPDLSPQDFDDLLDGLGQRRIALINTATASGPFIAALSAPNRAIVTATRSGRERNLTRFGLHFVDAFSEDGADVDKNARVSILEAFGYALREVEREYEGRNLILTEHAILDDNGDGEGSRDLEAEGGDGALAGTMFLGAAGGTGGGEATSPELRALYQEKAAIEARIADLRRVKAQLPPERYENELEELLIELALKNREIRAAGGQGRDSLLHQRPPLPPVHRDAGARNQARPFRAQEGHRVAHLLPPPEPPERQVGPHEGAHSIRVGLCAPVPASAWKAD